MLVEVKAFLILNANRSVFIPSLLAMNDPAVEDGDETNKELHLHGSLTNSEVE